MIKPQFSNILNSSFLLWLNNHILKKGQAFTNVSSPLYPISSQYNGLTTYAAPYNQFVSDSVFLFVNYKNKMLNIIKI